MNDALVALPVPVVPPEVQQLAAEKGVSRYLNAAVDMARHAFPSSAVRVSLGQDAEDEMHRYIALDVEAGGQTMAGQRVWSAGISRVCPSRHAVYFVLGWR
jgi:hypothetical protein